MLYYNRIDISQGIYPTKKKRSKECMTCHCCFFNHGFKFQDSVCKDCHDLTILYLNISDIAPITVINVGYPCIIYNITKSEAINLLERTVLEDNRYL